MVDEWKDHYVPFHALKALIESNPEQFEASWRAAVERSSSFYQGEKLKLLSRLRSGTDGFAQQVSDWVTGASAEENSAMLNDVLKIRNFGLLNAEGYRKSLKKYAKRHGDKEIVARLLPTLWLCAFHADSTTDIIQRTVTKLAPEWQEQHIAPTEESLLREKSSPEKIDVYGRAISKIASVASMASLSSLDDLRQLEFDMSDISRNSSLENLVGASMPETGYELSDEIRFLKEVGTWVRPELKRGLVCHRGFHDIGDEVSRPIENTLPAFDQAWLAGFHLCECDIAGSLDHHLVLSHDVELKRIALNPYEEGAEQVVETMDVAQIMALSLKSGVRVKMPPRAVNAWPFSA